MPDTPGELDLSDIEVILPPEGWVPSVVEGEPEPSDATDRDEEASA